MSPQRSPLIETRSIDLLLTTSRVTQPMALASKASGGGWSLDASHLLRSSKMLRIRKQETTEPQKQANPSVQPGNL